MRWCCCSTPDPRELSVSALTDDRGRIDPAAAGTAAPGGGGPGGGECDGGLTWRMRADVADACRDGGQQGAAPGWQRGSSPVRGWGPPGWSGMETAESRARLDAAAE